MSDTFQTYRFLVGCEALKREVRKLINEGKSRTEVMGMLRAVISELQCEEDDESRKLLLRFHQAVSGIRR